MSAIDQMARQPLHFIWVADCSGSMSGAKIASLNLAIRESVKAVADEAKNRSGVQVLMRAIAFDGSARWHVATPTPVESFQWTDLEANSSTDMAGAIQLLTEQLAPGRMEPNALKPVLVLVSDGQPNSVSAFDAQLQQLFTTYGRKAIRIGVAIGGDADQSVLARFINNPEIPVLEAHNSTDLVNKIRWASLVATKVASNAAGAKPFQNVPVATSSTAAW